MAKTSGRFMSKPDMDCEILRQIVAYDESTGDLLWKRTWGKRIKGEKVGTEIGQEGYMRLKFSGRNYQIHRLVWLYVHGQWPSGFVDHIDGNPRNNRIENLREASQSENLANSRKSKRNTSGFKGVSLAHNQKWRAYVSAKGKTHWLGYFKTKEEAFAARIVAASRLHGEFARHS